MKLNKQKSAFSLIEVLAVLFIVSVSLVGVLILAHQSIKAQKFNANTLVAYQLAQEGIEIFRVLRDNNWMGDDLNLSDVLTAESYCVDSFNMGLNSAVAPCLLYLLNNRYQHNTNAEETGYVPTNFSRLIRINFLNNLAPDATVEPNDNEAIELSSTVYWEEFGTNFEYTVSTVLYDWYRVK